MQSCDTKRSFCLLQTTRGKIWKLVSLPYGIVEAGRQWFFAVETWMKEEYGLSLEFGILQFFSERNHDGRIVLILAKVVDGFINAGSREAVETFTKVLGERFQLGAFHRPKFH